MQWIKIFESADEARSRMAENRPLRLALQDKIVCFVLRQNAFFAFENKCPHHGEALSKGSINYLGEIVCPWHSYRFNIKTGRECAERCRDLETFPVQEREDGVFVAI